jgi:spermidine/putrescine transport system ATP-binding protein
MTNSAPASPEIRLASLTKRFGEVVAVDDVSLDIKSGEFFSLLGPSGCGKTTTLRMIGGFEAPTAGSIELRGRDVTHDPPDKRPVNMVFQNYALFPHLDVAENVGFGLRRRKVPKDEITRRVGESLELVHLSGYERRKPTQLSGGQQQRVALARALVNRPDVLLLDEPLGALDLKLRKRLQLELKRIQGEVGITFVYVTHDQEEALTMSDRIAVMHHGRVEQLGTPEALYDRPTTPFVADFIGTTNLLHGTVEAIEDGAAVVRLDSGDVCRIGSSGRSVGQAVDVSLRPESIAIAAGASNGSGPATPDSLPDGRLSATIERSAYLGSAVQYLVRTSGGIVLTVLASKNADRLAADQVVTLDWAPDDALVLGDRPADPVAVA